MRRAVVLLSGGLDSATCLAWARREGFTAHALTVRYGQRHVSEVERAAEIARHLQAASHRIIALDLTFLDSSSLTNRAMEVPKGRRPDQWAAEIPSTYVPARNTLLLALAVSWGEALDASDLVIGVNRVDYSGYPDCRPAFLSAFEALARLGTKAGVAGRAWRVHAPLLEFSKAEIVRRAVAWGVPLATTLSCYDPDASGKPCGRCDACEIRARGFEEAGVTDPGAGG